MPGSYTTRLLVVLILFCTSFFVALIAQNTISDSLSREISRAKTDTSRFRLTNELSIAIYREYPDSAYQIVKAIIPEVEKLGHLPSVLELYYTKGLIYAKRLQYDSAIHVMEEAKAIAIKINDQVNQAHILDQIGHAYFYKNQIELGIDYLKEALALGEQIGNQNVIFKESANLGRLYTLTENFDSADVLINRALEVQQQLGNKRLQAEILTNLGLNAFRSNQLEKGVGYFNRSIQLMKEINDDQGLSIVHATLGYCYYNLGDLPNALENYNQALATIEGTTLYRDKIRLHEALADAYITSEDYDNALFYAQEAMATWETAYGNQENADLIYKQGRILLLKEAFAEALQKFQASIQLRRITGQTIGGEYYLNIGQCFEQISQPDSARYYYQKGIEVAATSGIVLLESQCLNGLGRISEQKGNTSEALQYYQTAYNKAYSEGYKAKEMEAAEGLYRIYKQQNNSPKALQFLEITRAIQDSLFNEENTREIARMEANFEFEKEKQQLTFEQEKENERQGNIRLLLGLALLAVSLVLIVGVFYFRSKQKANAKLSLLNEELVSQKSIVEKQKEKLEDLDKVKTRFFTNISHEFRTPLTIISGMTDQIKSKPEVWLDKGSKMIKQNTANLLNLINQILDLRKLESGKLDFNMIQADIIPYLRYLFESFESLAHNKDINTHLLIEENELVMDYDKEKILRIISNLLSNAIKFTPEGGDVYFMVNTLGVLKTPRVLTIKIKDTGIGIPPEKLPQVFDRFYQADESSTRVEEGTGIGLALCKELINVLGGEINVVSEEGQGSSFTVELPITNQAPLSKVADQEVSLPGEVALGQAEWLSTSKSLEIANSNEELPLLLIVEDNADVVQYLVACLEGRYNLIIAQDGQDGIDKAIENIPDAIISDVMMPRKDGYEVCDTLKNDERTSHIPIILLTAKADVESRLSGLRKRADDYLTKPFNEEELQIRLENQLEIRRNLQLHFQNVQPLPPDAKEEVQQENEFLQKIRIDLEANIDQVDYGIVQLCRAVAMSRSQLHRKIKALTGMSTSHYLRKLRLHKAKELLQNADLNVTQVAYEVGFRYPNHFSTAYLEEFGIRPSETHK